MATQSFIIRKKHGAPGLKIPFIVAMIDANGILQTIPFPPQEGTEPEDQIYGVELMINPASLSSNLSKIVGRAQTMTSFVEDHWGEELDTITFQGFTAAFVTQGNDIYSIRNTQGSPTQNFLQAFNGLPTPNGIGMGIHDTEIGQAVSERRTSISYVQFKRLLDIIRINGCFFDTFGLVSKRFYIMLSYGAQAYRGFFESVDVTENAMDPFRYQYTITFKSEETLYSYVNKGQQSANVVSAARIQAEQILQNKFPGLSFE